MPKNNRAWRVGGRDVWPGLVPVSERTEIVVNPALEQIHDATISEVRVSVNVLRRA
jgi:hypothetical protein